jgi:NAD(P)-dependent dehydrogenase (short-subunit alcohol dehydrogenase family)
VRRQLSASAITGLGIGIGIEHLWSQKRYAALEYGLEYRLVSARRSSQHLAAVRNLRSFSTMQPHADRCSDPARTFNPKVAGSSPARPIRACITPMTTVSELFGLEGRVAVVTGASGVLGGAIARALAAAGARVGLLARRRERLDALAGELDGAFVLEADVLDRASLAGVRVQLDRLDVLVNAAGGNVPAATTGEQSFFELPSSALDEVVKLNFNGTVLPCQILGEGMAEGGSIVNVSSLAAHRALTRVVGYGAAKAAVENLTRWLAVELAPRGVRVNAIAPGFFVGEQNRALLFDDSGAPTERGEQIVAATPMGRFGEPHELAGTVVWLAGAGASFVTGAVVPVDGGFDAFGGV